MDKVFLSESQRQSLSERGFKTKTQQDTICSLGEGFDKKLIRGIASMVGEDASKLEEATTAAQITTISPSALLLRELLPEDSALDLVATQIPVTHPSMIISVESIKYEVAGDRDVAADALITAGGAIQEEGPGSLYLNGGELADCTAASRTLQYDQTQISLDAVYNHVSAELCRQAIDKYNANFGGDLVSYMVEVLGKEIRESVERDVLQTMALDASVGHAYTLPYAPAAGQAFDSLNPSEYIQVLFSLMKQVGALMDRGRGVGRPNQILAGTDAFGFLEMSHHNSVVAHQGGMNVGTGSMSHETRRGMVIGDQMAYKLRNLPANTILLQHKDDNNPTSVFGYFKPMEVHNNLVQPLNQGLVEAGVMSAHSFAVTRPSRIARINLVTGLNAGADTFDGLDFLIPGSTQVIPAP